MMASTDMHAAPKSPTTILHNQVAKGDAGRFISKHHFALFRCEIRHKNPIYKKIQNSDQAATQQHSPRHIALRIFEFRRRIHGGIPSAESKGDVKKILHEGPERKACGLAGRLPGRPGIVSSRQADGHESDYQDYLDDDKSILGVDRKTQADGVHACQEHDQQRGKQLRIDPVRQSIGKCARGYGINGDRSGKTQKQ